MQIWHLAVILECSLFPSASSTHTRSCLLIVSSFSRLALSALYPHFWNSLPCLQFSKEQEESIDWVFTCKHCPLLYVFDLTSPLGLDFFKMEHWSHKIAVSIKQNNKGLHTFNKFWFSFKLPNTCPPANFLQCFCVNSPEKLLYMALPCYKLLSLASLAFHKMAPISLCHMIAPYLLIESNCPPSPPPE